VPADERDREAGGLVDDHHPRVDGLVPQQGGQQADRRADGEEGHDGVALDEGVLERADVVLLGVRQRGSQAGGGGAAGGGGGDEADHVRPITCAALRTGRTPDRRGRGGCRRRAARGR
jgi:hypothetical protein